MSDLNLTNVDPTDQPREFPGVYNANLGILESSISTLQNGMTGLQGQIDDLDSGYVTDAEFTQLSSQVSTNKSNIDDVLLQMTDVIVDIDDVEADLSSISGFTYNTTISSGTNTRVLTNDDYGKDIMLDSNSSITVVVPAGLVDNFGCSLFQTNVGDVTISGSGAIVNSKASAPNKKLEGQYAVAHLTYMSNDSYILHGDIT